jgi:hypothetical protein
MTDMRFADLRADEDCGGGRFVWTVAVEGKPSFSGGTRYLVTSAARRPRSWELTRDEAEAAVAAKNAWLAANFAEWQRYRHLWPTCTPWESVPASDAEWQEDLTRARAFARPATAAVAPPAASPRMVRCDCGHECEAGLVMAASLGTACSVECYDRMSD